MPPSNLEAEIAGSPVTLVHNLKYYTEYNPRKLTSKPSSQSEPYLMKWRSVTVF